MAGATAFFPGAGSFGDELRPLIDACRPAGFLVRYPGRFGHGSGTPADSFDAVVTACAEQLVGQAGHPVLFGHSYGAYVAYATALRMRDAGGVAGLVVVGADAPARLVVPPAALTDTERYLSGVDPQALAGASSQEWRAIVVDTAAQDLRLLAQFDTATSARLKCPVLAVRGAADRLTSDDGIGEWRHYTDGGFCARVLPGEHSTVLRDPQLGGCQP